MQPDSQQNVCFQGFTLDAARGCLTAERGEIDLRPKSFEVLRYLVEHAGRLVSKDELMQAIWPNVTVTEHSLTHCISEIRSAIGDRDQTIIKTVPRRGYLFSAPVHTPAMPVRDGSEPANPIAAVPSVSRRGLSNMRLRASMLLVVLALGVLAAAAFAWIATTKSSAPEERPSLAVLRFANQSGDPSQDYLAEGLSEDLITSLSRISNLFVIGRHSSFAYSGRGMPAAQIGRELGARYLLDGSVRRDGERIRVAVQLIDTGSRGELWAQNYDEPFTGVFTLQDDLTRKIVDTLVVRVNRTELARSLRKPPGNLAAYDYYLRGNALLKSRSGINRGEMVAQARTYFEQSLAADPNYVPSLQGLAEAYNIIWLEITEYPPIANEHRKPATLEHARTLADRAVALDPLLPEAHITRAYILNWQYEREEAQAEVRKALDLNPNITDGRIAHILMQNGHADEAIAFLERAVRHDPLPPDIYLSWLGNSYYLVGRYEEAYRALKAGSQKMPTYRAMFVWLAAAAAQAGHAEEAKTTAAMVLMQNPGFTIEAWLDLIRLQPNNAARLAEGLRKAGLPE